MNAKIAHRDWTKERRVLGRIMDICSKDLKNKAKKMIKKNKVPGWCEFSDSNLLKLRKQLVSFVKEGMLERKDMEMEIAFVALCIYVQRLSHEDRLGFFEL